jgi:3-keto-disaccharide hydrolase/WD40-like Beta Propeller Repeat
MIQTPRYYHRQAVFFGVLAVGAVAVCLLAGCGGKSDADSADHGRKPGERPEAKADNEPVAKKPIPVGLCRVYTPQPGFFVFVDGEPARSEKDEWLTTPCEMRVPRGAREITVARTGFRDRRHVANVDNDATVTFGNSQQSGPGDVGILDSAFLRAKTAEPVSLLALNTQSRELDPYITPDGRELYFVSDRNGVKAVYRSSRPSPFHYLGPPEPIETTRGYDLPASPSMTVDLLTLVFSVPGINSAFATTRAGLNDPFEGRETVYARRGAAARLPAVQVVRRGMPIYLAERSGNRPATYAAPWIGETPGPKSALLPIRSAAPKSRIERRRDAFRTFLANRIKRPLQRETAEGLLKSPSLTPIIGGMKATGAKVTRRTIPGPLASKVNPQLVLRNAESTRQQGQFGDVLSAKGTADFKINGQTTNRRPAVIQWTVRFQMNRNVWTIDVLSYAISDASTGKSIELKDLDPARSGVPMIPRKSAAVDAEFPPLRFGEPSEFPLPGGVPCLSSDGLRQYVFDGKTLQRATRNRADRPFGPLETIAGFTLPNYQPSVNRRSYSITDDEQWLFYESGGDLNMVRVFSGRGRGFVCRGRSIPPLPRNVASLPKKEPADHPGPKKPAVDPRTLPPAYPAFRKKLLELLKQRNYADARKHVKRGLADPALTDDRNLIAWDRDDVERTAAFWDDFNKAIGTLKPGDPIEIGPARLKFVTYAKGELVVASATRQAAKQPLKMPAVELVGIVDRQLGRNDAAVQLHVGCFRWFDERSGRNVALARLKTAGKSAEFAERLAARDAQQARHEFDRERLGQALLLARAVLKDHPNSKAAATARGIIDKAYSLVKWDPVGRRGWQIKDGSYTAAPGASRGSLLRSPAKFENFELRLEWRSDAANGQGGVYFRYRGSGDPVDNALKIQLADDFQSVVDPLCTGAVFKVAAPTENAVRKRGAWNTLRLRVRGETVQVEINGRKVLDTTVKNDKLPLKGHVALDGGLGGITYRKTLLIELPAAN